MSGSEWFLVSGSVLEVVGFAVGAVAVSEARRAFTTDPAALTRAWDRFTREMKEFLRLLSGRPRPAVVGSGRSVMTAAASMQGEAIVSIGPWETATIDEKIELLRTRVEQHDVTISHLGTALRSEEKARIAADAAEARNREALREALGARISQAAAGGLGKESFALFCFGLGVILSLVGDLSS